MAHSRYRLLFVCFLTLAVTGISHGQRAMGVDWEPPQNTRTALEQLESFDSTGVSIIEVSPPLPDTVWNAINRRGFRIYGKLDISYPVTQTFADPDSVLLESIRQNTNALLAQPSVEAIALFEYGPIHLERFQEAIMPYVRQIRNAGSQRLYYSVTSDQASLIDSSEVDFIMQDVRIQTESPGDLQIAYSPAIGGYRYKPSPTFENYLRPFKKFMDATDQNGKPVFVKGEWLLSMFNKHPSFKEAFRSLATDSDPIFPIPDEQAPEKQQSPLPVILLIVVWASVGLHYNASPLYRKSLFRYFAAHSFFIDDIFQRYIRSAAPATLLVVQNALLIAASVYAATVTFLNPEGLEALFRHIPTAGLLGDSTTGLALLAFAISLALSLLSITWLYLSHKRMNSLTQMATIYAWPLHVNLLVSTVCITLYASGDDSIAIAIFGSLCLLVQIASFFVSAFDTARYVSSRATTFTLTTVGVHILLLGALTVWALSSDFFIDTLILSVTL